MMDIFANLLVALLALAGFHYSFQIVGNLFLGNFVSLTRHQLAKGFLRKNHVLAKQNAPPFADRIRPYTLLWCGDSILESNQKLMDCIQVFDVLFR